MKRRRELIAEIGKIEAESKECQRVNRMIEEENRRLLE